MDCFGCWGREVGLVLVLLLLLCFVGVLNIDPPDLELPSTVVVVADVVAAISGCARTTKAPVGFQTGLYSIVLGVDGDDGFDAALEKEASSLPYCNRLIGLE